MSRARRWWWLPFALLACSSRPAPRANEASPGEWLAQVKHAHERADGAIAAGELANASATLERALEQPTPAALRADDLRVVHQDLLFRLSELAQRRNEPQRALLLAERGLALGRHEDLFSANLLVARGRALALLARDTEAASSYQEALAIDERLLRVALGGGAGGAP
jgi:tetratricopeptide (TPR) repeat protein